jgi:hypothetical protein
MTSLAGDAVDRRIYQVAKMMAKTGAEAARIERWVILTDEGVQHVRR